MPFVTIKADEYVETRLVSSIAPLFVNPFVTVKFEKPAASHLPNGDAALDVDVVSIRLVRYQGKGTVTLFFVSGSIA